ncbi:MAG TPA: hypothetical protein VJN95_03965 [Gemmatimonadales bacterium]|nr:hypothetical protein [Gemmatimonadales bacterium]
MPRALTVSRVTVAAGKEEEYLAAVAELAVLLERRGQNLWVFRNPRKAGQFLEFTESPSPISHRSRASRTGEELKVERRLAAVAEYAADAWELWSEVPLAGSPTDQPEE